VDLALQHWKVGANLFNVQHGSVLLGTDVG
jgi:hypothetical protein